jgi:hypothetical protein
MKQISRREFVAAGAAGFTFLPAHVLGRGGATPTSEKLNLAFVGIVARGSLNLTELNNLHQNIVALCDVDWRHREATGRRGRSDPNRLGAAGRMSPILLRPIRTPGSTTTGGRCSMRKTRTSMEW